MDSRLAPWSKLGAEYQRRFVRVDVLAQELGMPVETVVDAARKSSSCCMTHMFNKRVTHVAYNPDARALDRTRQRILWTRMGLRSHRLRGKGARKRRPSTMSQKRLVRHIVKKECCSRRTTTKTARPPNRSS